MQHMQHMISKQAVVIGSGPAGLAAAIALKTAGIDDLVVLEREKRPGGILSQCIHDGFGLIRYRQPLTGPEYAKLDLDNAARLGIPILLSHTVTRLTPDRQVYVTSPTGMKHFQAGTVILAMGCRERPRGAISIPGTRPAGILTAGAAQYLVNMCNLMIGKQIVILGSGDIGLIMARRLTLEGARVLAVVEKLPRPGGLPRNVRQCVEDFQIPFLLKHTITKVEGTRRVEAVTVSRLDADGTPVEGTARRIPCDTIILSVGLIPENELSLQAGLPLDSATGGPVTGPDCQTRLPGIFACGNVRKVHDLVDDVTEEAKIAGRAAAAFLRETAGGQPGMASAAAAAVADAAAAGAAAVEAGAPRKITFSSRDQKPLKWEIPGIKTREPLPANLTCIICPIGCSLTVRPLESGQTEISGARCVRGRNYAVDELTQPMRILTTTLPVQGGTAPLVSVRTTRAIPRESLEHAMQEIRVVCVKAPVAAGEVIIKDLLGLGADVTATAEVPAAPCEGSCSIRQLF
ncbi:MAG TPA: pyridine nucleotide-disulfide oxidoreductase [Clostridiales bacterium]|nr:pyridine nucleotide-disulfide oxidoreductase [Clostridiales bacterium]